MVIGDWWLVVGGWWLVVGGWWLVIGGWWLVVGGWWLVVVVTVAAAAAAAAGATLGRRLTRACTCLDYARVSAYLHLRRIVTRGLLHHRRLCTCLRKCPNACLYTCLRVDTHSQLPEMHGACSPHISINAYAHEYIYAHACMYTCLHLGHGASQDRTCPASRPSRVCRWR